MAKRFYDAMSTSGDCHLPTDVKVIAFPKRSGSDPENVPDLYESVTAQMDADHADLKRNLKQRKW